MTNKTLYVARVGLTLDLSALDDLFITVADVQSHRLEMIPESSSEPFGVFEMSSERDAADCVERFNGSLFNGRQLSIVRERPKPLSVAVVTSKKEKRKRA